MKRWHAGLVSTVALVALVAVGVIVHRGRPDRSPEAVSDGLHTDDAIQRLAPHDIAAQTKAARSILDMPCLDVVPNGSSRPRREVFQALGLDDSRVREFRATPVDNVTFLQWQVSASYDVVCMTANNAPDSETVPMTDLARRVYGIRLISRADRSFLIW
jgi:hypothetical protein